MVRRGVLSETACDNLGRVPAQNLRAADARGAAEPHGLSRVLARLIFPHCCDAVSRCGELPMPLDEIVFEAEEQMDKCVEFLRQELRTVRTGRASPGLVDSLRVRILQSDEWGRFSPDGRSFLSVNTPADLRLAESLA